MDPSTEAYPGAEPARGPVTGPGPGQSPGPPGPTVLRRPREGRMLFGVAAGLSRYLGVDAVVGRIAFVVLTLFGGSGVLLYLIGALTIPEEQPGDVVGRSTSRSGRDVAVIVGGLLIVAGTLALLGELVPRASGLLGPLLLVAAGAAVLIQARRP